MGHTEGPWLACRPGESDWSDWYWEIEDPYGHTATVYGNDAEAGANARLIAAAPEMLAALCEARDAFAAMDWEGEENWRHWDATRLDELIAGTLRVVNAALTKAGGSDASA